jgi:N utilization substance protein A
MYVQKRKEVNKMDGKSFKKAVEALSKEKGIDEDTIYDAMELALTSAYKKNYHSLSNVRVDINRETGDIKIYSFKTVVLNEEWEKEEGKYETEIITDEEGNEEEVEKDYYFDDRIHITLEEARKIVPDIKIDETIEEEVTPKDFGRVAAATAKQVVVQKIREAEREIINNEFADKQDEMVVGNVAMEDVRNYYIDLGRTQGILPKTEIIPGETIKMGSSIKVYISKVENNSKGPLILLSRSHYGFVKRLFELEIPEINEGIILVYSVARDAGNRTKIAVYSENPNVDPVGACIGERGSRISRIIDELNGEKIDVVPYDADDARFIENALSPARNLHVFVTDDKKKEALVVVDNENLSLAIGKKGLNVRLAARLTHYKIDVKTYEQAKELGISIVD